MKKRSENAFLSALEALPSAKKYYVALSGGVDSVVLLHAVNAYINQQRSQGLLNEVSLEAIHVHHGLSPNADDWVALCEQFCASLLVPLQVRYVSVEKKGKGLEAAARESRYEVFDDLVEDDSLLLQGHHLNDQAETVFFRFVRGMGLKGFAGIPQERSLKKGKLYRPFLSIKRTSIESYADLHQLAWCEDESNTDDSIDRNFIRHNVIPLLETRWSELIRNIAKVADESSRLSMFVDEWCEEQFDKLTFKVPLSDIPALDIAELTQCSLVRQEAFVRYWIDKNIGLQPSKKIFQRIWTEVLLADIDAQPRVVFSSWAICRYKSGLYLVPCLDQNLGEYEVRISLKDILASGLIELPVGSLSARILGAGEGNEMLNKPGCVYLDMDCLGSDLVFLSRQGGEKIKLKAACTSELKKLYQENQILPWYRDSLPLLIQDGVLIASLAGFVHLDYQCQTVQSSDTGNNILLLQFDYNG